MAEVTWGYTVTVFSVLEGFLPNVESARAGSLAASTHSMDLMVPGKAIGRTIWKRDLGSKYLPKAKCHHGFAPRIVFRCYVCDHVHEDTDAELSQL